MAISAMVADSSGQALPPPPAVAEASLKRPRRETTMSLEEHEAEMESETQRLLAELDEDMQRQQGGSNRRLFAAAQEKAASFLLDAPPGSESEGRLPLRLITGQRKVAWRWFQDGQVEHMIGIGCKRPFSPFSDE
mmetsp:Transcript_35874/g.95673  ORF Transcript_35874/g.95673 Transcript_35874/m.95673 type:complete len:135 (-) Transcript_35874:5-409(-)